MLRNRSRAVTSKQALMTDHNSQSPPSPTTHINNCTKPIQSFLASPRFRAFTFKGHLPAESDVVMSPTSSLDTTKPFSPFKNPFWHDISTTNQPKSPKVYPETKRSWDKLDSKGIGVALLEDIKPTEESRVGSVPKAGNNMVLRVQIPPLLSSSLSPVESPKSPSDFGIKTRNSQISASGSVNSGVQTKDSPKVFTGRLSITEMKLSEDYTCVISHGPNPKTTHIFDNCIVENYCTLLDKSSSVPKNFLSFCHTCKKDLEQKNDIYIYRGEKAFCSGECRYQEMLLDHEVENRESEDAFEGIVPFFDTLHPSASESIVVGSAFFPLIV